jgi:hypothetical protein
MRPLILLCLLLGASPVALAQTVFYVSPDGAGTNFSAGQPGNLVAARDAIRALSTNMTGDIVVYLRGGTYSLTNSFQLREDAVTHDSGTGGFNIIYENYPGETPVLSGAMAVTNWSLSDAGKNIWSAYVGNVNSRQLYVNGVRAIRARGPINPSGFVTNTAGTGFWTTNTAMQSWGNQTNIEIVCRNSWKQLRCPIGSISGTNIVMQTPGWTYSGNSPTPGPPWNGNGHRSLVSVTWVENAYELLAGPGMWYLNQATGYLYYIPRPGEDMTRAVVMLPVVEKLVGASGGDSATPIHNVVFSGITFEYGTWLLPSTSLGYTDNQTSILWPGPTGALKTLGNVSFQTAANIQLTNDVFIHLGGVAIDFGGGAHNNIVIGNHIEDISSGGITLGEVTDFAASDTNQMTDGNTIEDNYIRRVAQDYEDAIFIWIGYARNSLIAHNDMDNASYSGISLGWGWGTLSYAASNYVVGNFVGKVMQTLADGGSCYTLSTQTNCWEIGNYYKDSGYQGIYWDEGTAYYTALSNVIDHCAQNYVNIHSSTGTKNNHDNIATNNFSNVTAASDPVSRGTNDVITNTVFVTGQNWPPAAQGIIVNAGLEPAYAYLKSPEIMVNDTEANFDHVPGDWTYSSARGLGDYSGDVHYTQTDGQYVQYTFTGSAISWIGEMNPDMGNVGVYLDGVFQATVNCFSTTRVAQQRLFTATNLSAGSHSLKLVKNGGTYMILDAFAVVPVNFWLTTSPTAMTVAGGGSNSTVVKLDTLNGFAGSASLGVSGLPANCSASFNPPSLSGPGFSTLTIFASNNAAAGNVELTIFGTSGGITNLATVNLTVIPTPIPPPLPWLNVDVGGPTNKGSATYSNWVFTLKGSGNDIWSTGDAFNFTYQPVIGDWTNTARVATLHSSNGWAKTGVMLRESTNANSKYIGLYVTVSNGVSMQFRSGTGVSAVDEARAGGVVAPYWVRLVRSGNTFTGYRSSDGAAWTQVGTTNFAMATNYLAGLAVCAHDVTLLNTSMVDQVSVVPTDSDGDGIPDWWMLQYFGHASGSAADKSRAGDDADGDGMLNWQEYLAGTNPTNAASRLRMLSLTATGASNQINWTTVGGHSYVVQAAADPGASNGFMDVSAPIAVPGTGESSTNFEDLMSPSNRFYRVRLGP